MYYSLMKPTKAEVWTQIMLSALEGGQALTTPELVRKIDNLVEEYETRFGKLAVDPEALK
jgi:hypothetical protein